MTATPMKKFFHQDSILVGIVAELGSQLLFALLLWAVLAIIGEPANQHIRWFAGAFLPGLLVVRHYAKKKSFLLTTKTVITVFFITFVLFLLVLFKTQAIHL